MHKIIESEFLKGKSICMRQIISFDIGKAWFGRLGYEYDMLIRS